MGTWGLGPFDNDAAGDLLGALEEAQESASQSITEALGAVARAPSGEYIDVDDGSAAWAASELLAVASGHSGRLRYRSTVLELAAALTPTDEQRRLALEALSRIADQTTSELAQLWHEGDEGGAFDAALAELRERLEAAARS